MFQDGVKKTILSTSVKLVADMQWSTLTARFRQAQPSLTHTKTQRPLCKQSEKYDSVSTDFLRFPFSNFRYSLTLFSKFFASFPHGTCTLSVSHQYLALDGIYHPLWAAIPNNSTLRHLVQKARRTGVSPSMLPCSKGLSRANNTKVDRPQFGAKAQIHIMSSSPFSRPYWGNPC